MWINNPQANHIILVKCDVIHSCLREFYVMKLAGDNFVSYYYLMLTHSVDQLQNAGDLINTMQKRLQTVIRAQGGTLVVFYSV